KQSPVRGEGDVLDSPLQPLHLLAGASIPQSEKFVPAAGGEGLAVGREGDGQRSARVTQADRSETRDSALGEGIALPIDGPLPPGRRRPPAGLLYVLLVGFSGRPVVGQRARSDQKPENKSQHSALHSVSRHGTDHLPRQLTRRRCFTTPTNRLKDRRDQGRPA